MTSRAWRVGLHVLALIHGAAAESREYLLMSLPALRQVAYIALPDPTSRLLITSGLVNPKGLAVDAANNRLFVADPGQQPPKVYWYQLLEIGKGRLMTDGRQHVACDSCATSWIALDGVGSLYFTGQHVVPPPMVTRAGLFKRDAIALNTGAAVDPTLLYSTLNTGAPAKFSSAAGLATDDINVFWANGVKGTAQGSLVKAPATPPDADVAASVAALAANEDQVNGVCITPQLIFYTGPSGVFGVDKTKMTSSCDAETCVQITEGLPDPQGLVWDGDGTVYVADSSLNGGTVVSFPSGALEMHEYTTVATAPRVTGVALLQLDPDTVRTMGASLAVAAAVLLALL